MRQVLLQVYLAYHAFMDFKYSCVQKASPCWTFVNITGFLGWHVRTTVAGCMLHSTHNSSPPFPLARDWLSTITCIQYMTPQGINCTKELVMSGNRLEVQKCSPMFLTVYRLPTVWNFIPSLPRIEIGISRHCLEIYDCPQLNLILKWA